MHTNITARPPPRKPEFDPRCVHVGFVVDEASLSQVFLRVFLISPVSIIPLIIHTHISCLQLLITKVYFCRYRPFRVHVLPVPLGKSKLMLTVCCRQCKLKRWEGYFVYLVECLRSVYLEICIQQCMPYTSLQICG